MARQSGTALNRTFLDSSFKLLCNFLANLEIPIKAGKFPFLSNYDQI